MSEQRNEEIVYEVDACRNYFKSISNKAKNYVANVLPTIFPIYENYKDNQAVVDEIISGRLKITKSVYNRNFSTVENTLSYKAQFYDSATKTLLFYIMTNIKYYSNYIVISYPNDELLRSIISRSCLFTAINKLIKENVLMNTTKKGLYIVNHNYIFKGDIIKFIEVYVAKYPNGITFSNNKIVIK